MEIDIQDDSFLSRVADAIDESGVRCIPCLLRSLHGCYPTTLLACIQDQTGSFEECDWHHSVRGWDVPLRSGFFPHVLDGDWRYSRPAVSKLIDLAVRQVGSDASFLHVGSPSTYSAALKAFPNYGNHWLHDRNALRHTGIADLDTAVSAGFDVAIIDPPWYPEVTIGFLALASRVLRPGALVFVAQPAQLSRPGVLEERRQILDEIARLGYGYVATRPDFVRYETPHFEWVTLKSQVATLIPADWRLGDLLVLRFDHVCDSQRTELDLNDGDWIERNIGMVRFKIRKSPTGDGCTFEPLTDSGFAPSVSRRDPLRQHVGIWTSGNRVFACQSPDQACLIIDEIRQLMIRVNFDLFSCQTILKSHGMSEALSLKAANVILHDVMEHLEHGL